MALLNLTPDNPVVSFRLDQQIAAGNCTLHGTQTPQSISINNNGNTLQRQDGNRDWMMADTVYGCGDNTGLSDQGFAITFNSTVAGTVYIALRMAFVSTDVPSGSRNQLSFQAAGPTAPSGDFSESFTTASNCAAQMNGTGTTAPYMTTGLPNGLTSDNLPANGYFGWMSVNANISSTLAPQAFTVVQGSNTFRWTQNGDRGQIIEGMCIWLAVGQNWQHSLPNYNKLPLTYNLGPIQTKLATASSTIVRSVFVGDSLLRYGNNWGDAMEQNLSATYGAAGRYVCIGTDPNGADLSSNWGTRSGVVHPTVTITGGSLYTGPIYDLYGQNWSSATTGTLFTMSYSGGATSWEIIFAYNTNGGSFTVSLNNAGTGAGTFSTNGTANTFGKVSGTFNTANSGNTVTVSKSTTTDSAGVSITHVACGPNTGMRSMRLAIPGRAFGDNGGSTYGMFDGNQSGTTAQWASFLSAVQADLIVTGSANNSGNLAQFGQPFSNFMSTLTDSVSTGFTKILFVDLHIFGNTNPYTAVATVTGGSAVAFPPFAAGATGLGPQFFNNSLLDMEIYGRLPKPFGMVSLSSFLGLKHQVHSLYQLGFYNGTTSYVSDTNAGAITDWHWNQGSFGAVALAGGILSGLVTGTLPYVDEVANDSTAVNVQQGYTDPGISNVNSGTTYLYGGATKTGTLSGGSGVRTTAF